MSFIIHHFGIKGFSGLLRDVFQFESAGTKVFRVKNQEVGFSKEQSRNLFKRGSGLGLYLTWWIVQKHGGRIKSESEPGHWAQFTVYRTYIFYSQGIFRGIEKRNLFLKKAV
jgi:hypothetical protein